jgi:hypothetical protein
MFRGVGIRARRVDSTLADLKMGASMLKVMKGQAAPGDRLITRQPIAAGSVFFQIRGHKIVKTPSYQTVQIGVLQHAMALGTLASLNHSCHPNVVIDTKGMVCVATRDIFAGEELSYFYPSTEWVMARPFLCVCGATNCIRIVAGARHLSVDTLSRYFINAHIRTLIERELKGAAVKWKDAFKTTRALA